MNLEKEVNRLSQTYDVNPSKVTKDVLGQVNKYIDCAMIAEIGVGLIKPYVEALKQVEKLYKEK